MADVPKEDGTKTRTMAAEDCTELTRAVLVGKLNFDLFAKKAGAITGNNHAQCNTLDAFADAWLIMKPALERIAKIMDWEEMARGVTILDRKLTVSARSTGKTAAQLSEFVKGIARSYENALVRFRMFNEAQPSLEVVVQEFNSLYDEFSLEFRLAKKRDVRSLPPSVS